MEPEGDKRLQDIEQRTGERQNADFWNLLLDRDTQGEQAVQHAKVFGMWNQRVVRDFKTLNKELERDKMLTFEIYH